MAGWTKLDFDNNYSIRAEREWGHPNTRAEVRLGYIHGVISPILKAAWENLVPLIGIDSTDRVVVVGAGFGWGVEALIAIAECAAVGVDISDYIDGTKDSDEDADIDAAISANGLSLAGPRAQQIRAKYARSGARAKSIVLKESMLNAGSRNKVKNALGDVPTWIVTEDMIDEFTDAEIIAWKAEIDKLTTTQVAHTSRERGRTLEQLNALTGHKCVALGSFRMIG